MVQAGALGTVKEVHVWTNRPIWPQGGDAARSPSRRLPTCSWDLWLGPAPERPYGPGYHPFTWRGWWDFGTGALGDMACHTVNMPFMALNLRDPISVQAETSGHNKDSYPKWSVITFEFPATGDRAGAEDDLVRRRQAPVRGPVRAARTPAAAGSLIVGDKGKLFSPRRLRRQLSSCSAASTEPKVEFPKSPGHFQEWVRAIKGGAPAMSNFPDYAGPLTETILLGNLAVWAAASRQGQEDRVGRQEPQGHEHHRPGANRPAQVSGRLRATVVPRHPCSPTLRVG